MNTRHDVPGTSGPGAVARTVAAGSPKRSGVSGAAALLEVVGALQAYLEVRETERTRREAIAVWRDAYLVDADFRLSIVREYLGRAQDERVAVFRSLFAALDAAGEREDVAAFTATAQAIVTLARTNPLAALADTDLLKARLGDPTTVFAL